MESNKRQSHATSKPGMEGHLSSHACGTENRWQPNASKCMGWEMGGKREKMQRREKKEEEQGRHSHNTNTNRPWALRHTHAHTHTHNRTYSMQRASVSGID